MHTSRFILPVVLLAASAGRAMAQTPTSASLDSIVLVSSTMCWEPCQNEHLTLSRTGAVSYYVWIDHKLATEQHAMIPVQAWRQLELSAIQTRLETYPDIVRFDAWLCEEQADGAPTVRLVLYWPGRRKTIIHDRNCRATKGGNAVARLDALGAFEAAMETTAGSRPWLDAARQARDARR